MQAKTLQERFQVEQVISPFGFQHKMYWVGVDIFFILSNILYNKNDCHERTISIRRGELKSREMV